MIGVFVMLDQSDIGLGDHNIFLFDDEDSAIEWQFQMLIEAREIAVNPTDNSIWDKEYQQRFSSKQEAVDSWGKDLFGLEFFHRYAVRQVHPSHNNSQ